MKGDFDEDEFDDDFDDGDDGRCPDCGATLEEEHSFECTYSDDEDVEDFA